MVSDTYLCGVGLQILGDDVDDRDRDAAGQPQRRNDSVEVGVTEVTMQLRGRHSAQPLRIVHTPDGRFRRGFRTKREHGDLPVVLNKDGRNCHHEHVLPLRRPG